MQTYPVLPVRLWPSQQETAKADFLNEHTVVFGLVLPQGFPRDAARQELRLIACQFLSDCFQVSPDHLEFHNEPGKKSRIYLHGKEIFTSLSHEDGLSVIAFSLLQVPGVDIVKADPDFNWPDIAHLYLGERKTRKILELPAAQRLHQFALAWSMLEAKLKCLGMPLTEFSAIENQQMKTHASLRYYHLNLPHNYAGSLVTKDPDGAGQHPLFTNLL